MRYRVNRFFRGSPDGGRVVEFIEGQILEPDSPDFTPSLRETAIAEKWVTEVKAPRKKAAKKAK